MKAQADKNRTKRQFAMGDFVYLKLQPYVQSSVAARASHKLSFRYFGPYQITAKVGGVAYHLLLPESSAIHPVFHVSQLKKAIGSTTRVNPVLPPESSDSYQVPLSILDRHLHQVGTKAISQVLIHWSSLPISLVIWENEDQLKKRFPKAPAWGQTGTQGEGIVTTSSTTSRRKDEKQHARKGTTPVAGEEEARL
uniref:Tf2-1-like SH3-like domain-containing protein n=1 Tax=Arundo donax TaxID=35708 RepID=A0A0A9D935_ARUDO